MNIEQYINSHKDKAAARRKLAVAVGRSEITIRSWANGNRFPGREIWSLIVRVTKGKITIKDLIAASDVQQAKERGKRARPEKLVA
ncbi:MAG: hypothetical protein ACXWT0_00055 [Methylobacter sp.]